ncbi:DUF2637 domain-containing protein [Nocardiopsis sp. Huas11]|uniref:DUF2637 domain-containing protein n=1 Tax=Nocardiopsis sp. Huas11 TaxID=2183912 RepID=UPI00272B9CF6|nr:DUF2637 domain-containing protein [Nocardiopsis sp. Huas11]
MTSHLRDRVARLGEPEWRAALFPLSVDGMIVGASMTLLSDARHGRKGGLCCGGPRGRQPPRGRRAAAARRGRGRG